MIPYFRIFTFVVIALLSSLQIMAQTNDTIPAEIPQQTSEISTNQTKEKVSKAGKSTPSYFRHHKKLPATYSGFGIEITRSELPLKRDFHLFQQFGNVHYEKLEEGGYAYILLVKFSSKKALKNYVKQVVIPKAPDAKALVYKIGKRK